MKTEEFESLSAPMQAVANEVYLGMLRIEADKNAMQQMALEMAAQTKGTQNAAQSGGGSAQPDAPAATAGDGGASPPTPNQPANQNVPQRGA